MEARSVGSRPVSQAAVVALVIVSATPLAAAEDCGSPAEGAVVCETDTDDRPDTVTVTAGEDGVGSAHVFVEDHTGYSFISRIVEASAATAEGSPVGAREADATAWCGSIQEGHPCHMGYAEAGADAVGDGVALRADCDEIATGSTPVCDSSDASAGIDLGSEAANATARCGGIAMEFPCPLDLQAGLNLTTRARDAGVLARAKPGSVSACVDTAPTGFTCLP